MQIYIVSLKILKNVFKIAKSWILKHLARHVRNSKDGRF